MTINQSRPALPAEPGVPARLLAASQASSHVAQDANLEKMCEVAHLHNDASGCVWLWLYAAGSRRDQQQAFFIGGSEELQDLTYMAVPRDHKGPVLNKYGYKTQASGNVKVGMAAWPAGRV
jgi:hypothetical protein